MAQGGLAEQNRMDSLHPKRKLDRSAAVLGQILSAAFQDDQSRLLPGNGTRLDPADDFIHCHLKRRRCNEAYDAEGAVIT